MAREFFPRRRRNRAALLFFLATYLHSRAEFPCARSLRNTAVSESITDSLEPAKCATFLLTRVALSIRRRFSLFLFPDERQLPSPDHCFRSSCQRFLSNIATDYRRSAVGGSRYSPRSKKSRASELVGRTYAGINGSALRPSPSGHQSCLQSSRRRSRTQRSNARWRLSFRMAQIRSASAFRHHRLSSHHARRRRFLRIARFESRTDRATISRLKLG